MIEVEAQGNTLRVKGGSKLLVSGCVDVYQLQLTLSPDWDALDTTVCFRCCGVDVSTTLGEDGLCTIPAQALANPGVLSVALSGKGQTGEILQTPWARVGIIFPAPQGSAGTSTETDPAVPEWAKKGKDFTVVLPASGWSDGSQVVSDENLIADGYSYIYNPAKDSRNAYVEAVVYFGDVLDGSVTAYCSEPPSADITVHVVRLEVED
jgi:hypothetical protein